MSCWKTCSGSGYRVVGCLCIADENVEVEELVQDGSEVGEEDDAFCVDSAC